MIRAQTLFAWALAAMLVLAFTLPATAGALTMLEGSTVTLAEGDDLADDLYAFGNTITIDGNVDGDVVAFGQIVVINGDVSGSVMTAAQSVRIDGTVGGTVRAAGATVDVSGMVRGDVLAGAAEVTVPGDVDRDLAAGAQRVEITGSVGRNVMVGSESLRIAGDVGGDVQAESSRVTVASDGNVVGDLDYWSADPADIEGAVSGTTTQHEPTTQTRQDRDEGSGVAGAIMGAIIAWIQSYVGLLLLGVLLVFVARTPMGGGSQAVANRPLPSLGVGLLVFFATPVVAFFVFALGLLIGAWWLSFVLLTVYWLLLLAGLIVGGLALGRAILGRSHAGGEPALVWSFLLGFTLVWLAAAVPLLGWLFAWAAMLMGTGALVLLWMGKADGPVPTPTAPEPQAPTAPPVPPAQ